MKPAEFYATLCAEITDRDERAVFDALARKVNQFLTRDDLMIHVFGTWVPRGDRGWERMDRSIRKCIEALRTRGYPIVATSGEAGYKLVDDPAEMDACIAEEGRRILTIQRKIDAMYRSKDKARSIHEWREATQVAVQAEMFSDNA